MVNDPFSDLPFFFWVVIEETIDPRSQIRFWILLKIRSLRERFHASLPSHLESFAFLKEIWPWPSAISDWWVSIRLVCFCVLRSIACVLPVSGYIIYYFTLKILTDLVVPEQPYDVQRQVRRDIGIDKSQTPITYIIIHCTTICLLIG